MKSEVVDQCSTDNTCFRIVEILSNFSLYCRKNRKESIINSSFKKRNCVKRHVQIEKYPSYLSEFRVSIIISVADQTHATNNFFFFSKKKKARENNYIIFCFSSSCLISLPPLKLWHLSSYLIFGVLCTFLSSLPLSCVFFFLLSLGLGRKKIEDLVSAKQNNFLGLNSTRYLQTHLTQQGNSWN